MVSVHLPVVSDQQSSSTATKHATTSMLTLRGLVSPHAMYQDDRRMFSIQFKIQRTARRSIWSYMCDWLTTRNHIIVESYPPDGIVKYLHNSMTNARYVSGLPDGNTS